MKVSAQGFNSLFRKGIAPALYMGLDTKGNLTGGQFAGTVDSKTGHREIQVAAKYYF